MSDITLHARLDKVGLPDYTIGEEMINCASHGIGAGLSIVALVLCLQKAMTHGGSIEIVSAVVFGLSLIFLYLMSSIYHGVAPNDTKKVLRIIDHCSIFILIAGSYTPFTLLILQPAYGYPILSIVWILAVVGICLNAFDVERFKGISMACYLGMGWCIVFAFHPLASALNPTGLTLLVWGGIAYTVGAIIFGLGSKIRYMHSVWHFFVLTGSILHFLCVYQFVL